MTTPSPPGPASSEASGETRAVLGVAGWTAVSRATGLLRVVAVGATLGPTFFANVFAATNTVPNMTYSLLAGSLLSTLVVPPLVAALDREGEDAARRLASGVLGVVLAGFCGAGVLVLGAGPLLVRLLTLGVDGPGEGDARAAAWVLLLLVLPQIALYGVAAVGVAAQNARSRFALAAAAPAVENLGLVVTLVLCARWFGTGIEVDAVTSGHLVVLGLGSTLAVTAHATLQLVGAARAGLPLRPTWGWRDPAVRAVLRRVLPTIGTAMLDVAWFFTLIVAAGTVPGGVIAVQVGMNFYNLPLALSARALGTVLQPRLAREVVAGRLAAYAEVYRRGLARAEFLAVPAAVALVALGSLVAEALAVGRLDGRGADLLAAAITALALALPAAAVYEVARSAAYARLDVRSPFVAAAAQVGIVLAGAATTLAVVDGTATIAGLGLSVVAGDLVRARIVHVAAVRAVPPSDGRSAVATALRRDVGAALACMVPAALAARAVALVVPGRPGTALGLALAAALGAGGYLALQARLGAPELVAALPLRRRWPAVP